MLYLESLIFSSPEPMSNEQMHAVMEEVLETSIPIEDIDGGIDRLLEKYKSDEFSFELARIDNGYTFRTKGSYHSVIGTHLKNEHKKKLTKAAMETLSIIAYKQPVTKLEIEQIRGVNCDYTIEKLLEKDLITIVGRKDAPGKPLVYSTSSKFMNHFGLGNINELPSLKEIQASDNEIGDVAPIEVPVISENDEKDNGNIKK